MKKQTIKLIQFICLIFPFVVLNAQNNPKYSTLIKECDDYIIQNMTSQNVVGVSAAIIINDSVIWKNGYGFADLENKIPMTANTVVNIGSITKTFTALALMQLQEKGLLDINEPLNKYLPQFKPLTRNEDLKQLTVKSVITHCSGIQSDILKNNDLTTGKYTDVLGFINETFLLYPPGMVESYSNSGYNILGHLIKEVSKQDYQDYIKNNIFSPLRMNNSGFAMDGLKNKSKIYAGGNEVKEYAIRDIASGGIYTNINDLAKYAIGLMDAYNGINTSFVKKETIKKMFTHQGNTQIEKYKKGLGWFMFKNDSAFALSHGGSSGFFQANLYMIPEKKAAVLIFTNTAGSWWPLVENFSDNFLNKFGLSYPDIFAPPIIKEIHKELKPIILPDSILLKHAGDYSQGFSVLTISVEDKNLTMVKDNKRYLLKALSTNEFVPYEIIRNDSIVCKDNERYCFLDVNKFHILFQEIDRQENQLGYKLNKFDISPWGKKLGVYEQYGYQMIVGDTKLTKAELLIADNRILMLKLTSIDGDYQFPLNVISEKYAVTSGLGTDFITAFAYTIKILENDKYNIIDFGGLTFRKEK